MNLHYDSRACGNAYAGSKRKTLGGRAWSPTADAAKTINESCTAETRVTGTGIRGIQRGRLATRIGEDQHMVDDCSIARQDFVSTHVQIRCGIHRHRETTIDIFGPGLERE